MTETRYIFIDKLDAVTFDTIDRVCLPVAKLVTEDDLKWFAQFDREAISYINDLAINAYLLSIFSKLRFAENEKYKYNINDTVFIVTKYREPFRSFDDLRVVVIFKGQYEC